MRPDLQSCLLCDDVRQERNGKFMLIGLFDSVGVPHVPLPYPRICVVTRWCSGEGEFTQHTRILRPDQDRVAVEGKNIPFRLATTEATATNVEIFANIPLQEAGTHWVEILCGDDMALRFPFRVTVTAQPPVH